MPDTVCHVLRRLPALSLEAGYCCLRSLVRSVCREEGGIERHVEEVKFANFMKRKKAFPGYMESAETWP